MTFRRLALAAILLALPGVAFAQSDTQTPPGLSLELNAAHDVDGACRLIFLVQNNADTAIDAASYESVIFDASGTFVRLTLFEFRDLPAGRPRVRRFDVRDTSCDNLGRVLINGLSSCTAGGAESTVCDPTPTLRSRTEVELLG
ncbi:hypothetical protein [Ruegeria sp.]|uniref:hypothetical protein n=1 Tax=Ruegeria sp. TaxID=1879320 RepID=UPI003B59C40C